MLDRLAEHRRGSAARQLGKPRSSPVERVGDLELPSFRGYNVNAPAFTPAARVPDPLRLIRGHWGVETNHQILDTAFEEDDRLWIVADARGLLNVLVLRRLAYTLMTLYRSVTQRSSDERQVRWRDLMARYRETA